MEPDGRGGRQRARPYRGGERSLARGSEANYTFTRVAVNGVFEGDGFAGRRLALEEGPRGAGDWAGMTRRTGEKGADPTKEGPPLRRPIATGRGRGLGCDADADFCRHGGRPSDVLSPLLCRVFHVFKRSQAKRKQGFWSQAKRRQLHNIYKPTVNKPIRFISPVSPGPESLNAFPLSEISLYKPKIRLISPLQSRNWCLL